MELYYRQIKFKIPIYNSLLYLVDTNDCEKLNQIHDLEEDKEPYGSAFTLYKENPKGGTTRSYMILLNTKGSYGEIPIGVLAHECLHIVNMMFGRKGMVPDFDNDEAQAYLLEFLMDRAYSFYYNKK